MLYYLSIGYCWSRSSRTPVQRVFLLHCVVLLLRHTKRGVPDSERVLLWDPGVVKFVIEYYHFVGRQPYQRFIGLSYSTVMKHLDRALVAFGFSSKAFTTHSCRRGGATAMSLKGWTYADIVLFGRWASEQSARVYIMKGAVAVMRIKQAVSDQQWNLVEKVASIGCRVWDFRPFFKLAVPVLTHS